MTSNNKMYELVNVTQESNEPDSSIPQGIPMQTSFPQQQQHRPHNQMPVYPQMMPPQYIQQQPMPQYTNTTMPYYQGGVPQYQIAFTQMNPAQLQLSFQNCESEIRKYEFSVIVNWIMIGLHILGVVAAIAFAVFAATLFDAFCEVPEMARNNAARHGGHAQDFPFTKGECIDLLDGVGTALILFVVVAVLIICSIMVFIHYKGIVAYRDKKAETMECMFVVYGVLFVMSILGMNCIGMAGYGSLTYAAHKCKTLFAERCKIEAQMRNPVMNNAQQPIYPQQY
mmetsp:Transcript_9769/g.11047  ORF Transcript_9769/g.11047 Transcript_9769/m.11047 type:complete len:283 (+) Transcript_9769:45-893(+)